MSDIKKTKSMPKAADQDVGKATATKKESATKIGSLGSQEKLTMEETELKYGATHILQLFVPVTLCLLMVATSVRTLPFYSEQDVRILYAPFSEKVDSTTERFLNSLGNALILMSVVILSTLLLIMFYIYRCYRLIEWWLILSSVMALFVFTGLYILQVCKALEFSMDYVTAAIICWNIGVVGMVAIYLQSPLRLQQAYLIFVSVILSLCFIKWLPQWTTWIVLCFLIIWDLVAVLCPKGPLRILVETAKERNEPIFPAMIYSSCVHLEVLNAEGEAEKNESVVSSSTNVAPTESLEKQPKSSSETKGQRLSSRQSSSTLTRAASGVKLGLGDFIFYSVLIGNTSKFPDWHTTIACFVAILVGLGLTLILLAIFKKALPALPISLTFGLVFLACTSIFVQPFADRLAYDQVFI